MIKPKYQTNRTKASFFARRAMMIVVLLSTYPSVTISFNYSHQEAEKVSSESLSISIHRQKRGEALDDI